MVKNSQPVYIYIVAFLSDKIVIQNLTDCLLTAGNKYSGGKKRIQNVIHWVYLYTMYQNILEIWKQMQM